MIWTPETLNGLEPATGSVHSTVPLEPNFGMSIVAPVQIGDALFTSGIKKVGVMLNLSDEGTPKETWRVSAKLGFDPVHSPMLASGTTLYGIGGEGELTAVNAATGNKLWDTYAATTGDRRASSATAFLVRNGERFYIFNEKGELVIAKLTPEKYEELSRAQLIEPTQDAWGRKVIWSCPAFANRCVFVRNDNEIVCVDLAAH